jgi:hypothetical protein
MKAQICPYLGLKDDSGTTFSYASAANHCFRITPVVSVKLDHQREYCLSSNHRHCELFRGEPGQSQKRTKDIARHSRRVRRWIRTLPVWLFLPLIVIASIFAVVLFMPDEALTTLPSINSEIPPTMVIERTKTPPRKTAISSPSASVVVHTPTMLVVHVLESPIGTQKPLIIHQVREGENLSDMANLYNTTEDTITSLNYNFSLPLLPNAVIVIPLNQVNVNDLPLFEPYRVTQSISIQALAVKFSVDIDMLMVYNLVDPEYIFTVGEWVLIPHSRLATPTE